MSINKTRSALYAIAKLLGNVAAGTARRSAERGAKPGSHQSEVS